MDESVRIVARNLLQRAEDYKTSVEGIIKRYNERLQQTEGELKDILDQLDKQQNLNKEAVGIIAKVNEEIKSLETENITLEESLIDLKSELSITKGKLQAVEETRSTLEQELEEEKESNTALALRFREAHEKMAEIEKLTRKVSSLEEQNECYSKECELYKGKVNEYEKELTDLNTLNKSFSEQCERYEDLFMKYKILEYRNVQLEKHKEFENLQQRYQEAKSNDLQLEGYSNYHSLANDNIQTSMIEVFSVPDDEDYIKEDEFSKIINDQTRKIKDMIELKEKSLDVIKHRLRNVTFMMQKSENDDNKDGNIKK